MSKLTSSRLGKPVRTSVAKSQKLLRDAASPPGGRSKERREQQRSIESRLAILHAALSEFAHNGFDGASMRDIGIRAGVHYTLITYHFRNKELLWRATAEHFFGEVAERLETEAPPRVGSDPIDRIRDSFHALLHFSAANPNFHHFMIREGWEKSPRLTWLTETLIVPLVRLIVPLIEEAQAEGQLPEGSPILIYYFMISVISTLSAMGGEIRYGSGLSTTDPDVIQSYWELVQHIIFERGPYDRG
jgi:TetR/AcrR family transcriptional regulator